MQVPAPFDYERARDIDHALALLEQHGEDARIIAGGHSLLPMMKLRLARPDYLIDINDLTELDFIAHDDDLVRIGAMTRHTTLLQSDLIATLLPIITDAERVIADPVVRNRGTIGGSLCQADPGEDLSTVCDALSAQIVIRGPNGERTVAMTEFHFGPFETAVEPSEILTEIRIPVRSGGGSAYHKVKRRVGDWAIAAAGVAVWMSNGTIDEAGIGLTNVGVDDGPATQVADVVRGEAPSEELFTEAGRAAAAAAEPIDDQRGTAAYKRHLAGELTTRALRTAVQRAQAA